MIRFKPSEAILLVDDDGDEYAVERQGGFVSILCGVSEIVFYARDADILCRAIMDAADSDG